MKKFIYAVTNGQRYAPSEPEEYWKIKIEKTPQGYMGVFADEPIPAHSVIIRDGGTVVSSVDDVPKDKCYAVLLRENMFLAPNDYNNLESCWYLNHSCEPNISRIGGLIYIAKKDINTGEELTIDYAPLIAGISGWSLKCQCGTEKCRKLITGNDWKNPILAKNLWNEWLPFIQRKIHNTQVQE